MGSFMITPPPKKTTLILYLVLGYRDFHYTPYHVPPNPLKSNTLATSELMPQIHTQIGLSLGTVCSVDLNRCTTARIFGAL